MVTTQSNRLDLRPLRADEFHAFRNEFIEDWAEDLSTVEDISLESARQKAGRRTDKELKDVKDANRHRLRVVEVNGQAIGRLWYSFGNGKAFVDDIAVAEKFRGNGFGQQAFRLMEAELVTLGAELIQLNVYTHNPRAVRKAEVCGYWSYNEPASIHLIASSYLERISIEKVETEPAMPAPNTAPAAFASKCATQALTPAPTNSRTNPSRKKAGIALPRVQKPLNHREKSAISSSTSARITYNAALAVMPRHAAVDSNTVAKIKINSAPRMHSSAATLMMKQVV